MAVVRAFFRLAVVVATSGPMVKALAPGGESVVAVRVRVALEPSGRLKRSVSVSPGLGWPLSVTPTEAGEPVGPLTVALASVALIEASLKPNGDTASSAT